MFGNKPSPAKRVETESPFRRAFSRSDERKRPPLIPKKPDRPIRWGLVFLWVLFFGTVAYTLLFAPFHRVEMVSVSGSVDIPREQLEDFLRREISGTFFRAFPRNGFYLIRSGKLERDLLSEFPKLRSAEVRRIFPNRLTVTVSERERIMLWCSAGPCYLVADDGRAADARFAERPENEPFLVRVADEDAKPVHIGEQVFDPSFVWITLSLEKGLREQLSLDPDSDISSPSRISKELRFRVGSGWELFVSTEISPQKTLATLETLLSKELDSGKLAKLRYVDLRTENRAFYSFIAGESDGDEEISADAKADTEEKKKK